MFGIIYSQDPGYKYVAVLQTSTFLDLRMAYLFFPAYQQKTFLDKP